MGVLQWLGFGSASKATAEIRTVYRQNLHALLGQLNFSPADLYESQPELRTVIDFIGEQAAQTGLHMFRRQDDGGKARVRNEVAAKVLNRPTENTTSFEFIESLIKDYALNDNAYIFVEPTLDADYPYKLHNILCSWIIGTLGGDAWGPEYYVVQPPGADGNVHLPASQVVAFNGWSPTSHRNGKSKVYALKLILKEQMHAYETRVKMWESGGRVGTVIKRPESAPEWSLAEQRKWMGWFKRRKAGDDIMLMDGMEMEQLRFSAHDEDFVEASKLALNRVASIYGVSPIMIGQTEDANYSNAKIFREMLYGETLGPYFKRIVTKLNSRLLPMLGATDDLFVEFNIKEKMQSSFEEQASAYISAGGAPYMTRNEIRALSNLPAIEGGDDLIVPLNLLAGGQVERGKAAPLPLTVGGKSFKALTTGNSGEDIVMDTLNVFVKRQASSVLGKLGAKGIDSEGWWNAERWNRELEDELLKAAKSVAEIAPDGSVEGYDAAAHAAMINSLTRQQLVTAVKAGHSTSDVFAESLGSRLPQAASALVEAVLGR